MPGFTIGWEYLTGRCVASDPASRERAEWPPHPARVFMALAAAWFETGEDIAAGEALRWLEALGDPELVLPARDRIFHRSVVDVFVPVNDTAGPASALLQSAPITRAKQPRTFPSCWVGDAPCFFHWPMAADDDIRKHRDALARLCSEVTRIGHSSSLVRMWVAKADEMSGEVWVPEDGLSELQVRRLSPGMLDLLERLYNRRGREQHQAISERIAVLKAESPTGKGSKERKLAIKSELEELERQLKQVDARDPIRPTIGLWTGYRRKPDQPPPTAAHTHFDSDLLILTHVDGPRLPAVSTLLVTQVLRKAILDHLQSAIPEWVSGHKANGEPLRNGNNQLAIFPLPFVGHEHADGHLLGVAIAFPRSVARPERGRVLGSFILSPNGEPRDIHLTLGRLGVWTLRKRDWAEPRYSLRPETWTAHPEGAESWASVTPVVLDRFPKCDPDKERQRWLEEVGEIVSVACERLGLPRPVEVAVTTTSRHRGSPRALAKRRPLRGHPELSDRDAVLGDGFPPYPTKGSNGPRPQFHVRLRFAEPVVGPILIGAGRFFGYGLCKPLRQRANR